MLKETAKKYWTEEYDLNCAECIIYAANEEYNLNLSEQTLKVMAGFGGGMATRRCMWSSNWIYWSDWNNVY